MSKVEFVFNKTGLLVSVRNAEEARAALAGGADVIDVKEPSRGSLGAADRETISEVVRAVAGRASVSAAMGELVDLAESANESDLKSIPQGVSLFKVGLANCARLDDWRTRWQRAITEMTATTVSDNTKPVAVVYADWRAAKSPPPIDVLSAAIERHCPALLIDTWDKSSGTLFDHWPEDDLKGFLAKVRAGGIATVLAGSLTGPSVATAAQLAPDLVAVRTAACVGGREGCVSEGKVRELKIAIAASMKSAAAL